MLSMNHSGRLDTTKLDATCRVFIYTISVNAAEDSVFQCLRAEQFPALWMKSHKGFNLWDERFTQA